MYPPGIESPPIMSKFLLNPFNPPKILWKYNLQNIIKDKYHHQFSSGGVYNK